MRNMLKSPAFICFILFCVLGVFIIPSTPQASVYTDNLGHRIVIPLESQFNANLGALVATFILGLVGAVLGWFIQLICRLVHFILNLLD